MTKVEIPGVVKALLSKDSRVESKLMRPGLAQADRDISKWGWYSLPAGGVVFLLFDLGLSDGLRSRSFGAHMT